MSVPYPFIIPGGRFREIYYWDSLWVIQGLLVSGMDQTARSMIYNFVDLIKRLGVVIFFQAYEDISRQDSLLSMIMVMIIRFGHIPNGNRVYYLKRSQPPILALAVDAYRKHPNVPPQDQRSLIDYVLPFLEKEHNYWMRRHKVVIKKAGKTFVLHVYKGGQMQPRPESYWEDVTNAAKFNDSHSQYDFNIGKYIKL